MIRDREVYDVVTGHRVQRTNDLMTIIGCCFASTLRYPSAFPFVGGGGVPPPTVQYHLRLVYETLLMHVGYNIHVL